MDTAGPSAADHSLVEQQSSITVHYWGHSASTSQASPGKVTPSLPFSFPQSLEQLRGTERSSGTKKEQKFLMGKQRRDVRSQKGLRRQRSSQNHKIRE